MEQTAASASRGAPKARRTKTVTPATASAPKSLQRRVTKASAAPAAAPAPAPAETIAAPVETAAAPAKPSLTVVREKAAPRGPEPGVARPRHTRGINNRVLLDQDVSALPTGSERTSLAQRLFWARNQLDPAPTQAAAADVVRISRGAYSQWEMGLTAPGIDKIMILAKWFKVDPAWLAFGTPPDQMSKSGLTAAQGIQFDDGEPEHDMSFGIPTQILEDQGVSEDNVRVFQVTFADKALGIQRNDRVYVDISHKRVMVPGAYAYLAADMDQVSVGYHNDVPYDATVLGRVFGLAYREI